MENQPRQQQEDEERRSEMVDSATDGLAGLTVRNFKDNQEEEEEADEDDDERGDSNGEENYDDDDDDETSGIQEIPLEENISPAALWTKKEISEFKTSIRAEGGSSVIKVGHGETMTVRVPTHAEGCALFWEFATDGYDIAFGLFFEWNKSEDETEVSVHMSESEDEDEEDADEYEGGESGGDPESGSGVRTALVPKGPPLSVILPIYRRDSHQEVYVGTHQYPGSGVYLLKFDNTYSLWRSKTLYYRVYYTR